MPLDNFLRKANMASANSTKGLGRMNVHAEVVPITLDWNPFDKKKSVKPPSDAYRKLYPETEGEKMNRKIQDVKGDRDDRGIMSRIFNVGKENNSDKDLESRMKGGPMDMGRGNVRKRIENALLKIMKGFPEGLSDEEWEALKREQALQDEVGPPDTQPLTTEVTPTLHEKPFTTQSVPGGRTITDVPPEALDNPLDFPEATEQHGPADPKVRLNAIEKTLLKLMKEDGWKGKPRFRASIRPPGTGLDSEESITYRPIANPETGSVANPPFDEMPTDYPKFTEEDYNAQDWSKFHPETGEPLSSPKSDKPSKQLRLFAIEKALLKLMKDGTLGWYEQDKGLPPRSNKPTFTANEIAGLERDEHITFPKYPEGHPQAGQWTGQPPKSNYASDEIEGSLMKGDKQRFNAMSKDKLKKEKEELTLVTDGDSKISPTKETLVEKALLKLMKADKWEEPDLTGHDDSAMDEYLQHSEQGGKTHPYNHLKALNRLANGKYHLDPHDHEDMENAGDMDIHEFEGRYLDPEGMGVGISFGEGKQNVGRLGGSNTPGLGRLNPRQESAVNDYESGWSHMNDSVKQLQGHHGLGLKAPKSNVENSLLKLMKDGNIEKVDVRAIGRGIKSGLTRGTESPYEEGQTRGKKPWYPTPFSGKGEEQYPQFRVGHRAGATVRTAGEDVAAAPVAVGREIKRQGSEAKTGFGWGRDYEPGEMSRITQAETGALPGAAARIGEVAGRATRGIAGQPWLPSKEGITRRTEPPPPKSDEQLRLFAIQNSLLKIMKADDEEEKTPEIPGKPPANEWGSREPSQSKWASKWPPDVLNPSTQNIAPYGGRTTQDMGGVKAQEQAYEREREAYATVDNPEKHEHPGVDRVLRAEGKRTGDFLRERRERMADIKGLPEYTGTEPDPRMEPGLGDSPPPHREPYLSEYKAREAARKAQERPTQVRGNWQNMVENSLLKIMKYGSNIKPAEVGMSRKNAMQDMEKAPTAEASRVTAEQLEAQGGGGDEGAQQAKATAGGIAEGIADIFGRAASGQGTVQQYYADQAKKHMDEAKKGGTPDTDTAGDPQQTGLMGGTGGTAESAQTQTATPVAGVGTSTQGSNQQRLPSVFGDGGTKAPEISGTTPGEIPKPKDNIQIPLTSSMKKAFGIRSK